MIAKSNDCNVMLSSFELSPDELLRIGVGVATALMMLKPSSYYPVCVLNEYDDFFGNSVNIVHKHQEVEK